MKKTLLFLSCLVMLFSSCSNEYELTQESAIGENKQSEVIRWYGTKSIDVPQSRGVADNSKIWAVGAIIDIKFINEPSDATMIDKIKSVAKEWEQYANITFNFVDKSNKAPIRVAFDWNDNEWLTWSYTGNDAKMERSQNEPTAVFGSIEYLSEEEFRGDVLRVFGQILGLEYEQRHSGWDQELWKKDKKGVYYAQKYWEGMFENYDEDLFDWEIIKEFVFDPLASQKAIETPSIDNESIMMWPHYTRKETPELYSNFELSEMDKQFIASIYPKKQSELPTIQEAWVDPGFMEWWTDDKGRLSLSLTSLGREQKTFSDVSDGEQLTSVDYLFSNASIVSAPMFNTANVVTFRNMFQSSSNLEFVPHYNTSKGETFEAMFYKGSSLKSVPAFDTANGKNFSVMFTGCETLVVIPQLNTVNGVDFQGMFSGCTLLTSIPELNITNGVDFSYMFQGCSSLTTVPQLETSSGEIFRGMFEYCYSLTSIPELNTSKGEDFSYMFSQCTSLEFVPQLDTSLGNIFGGMFSGCSRLGVVPDLDTSNGFSFKIMFKGCEALEVGPQLDTHRGTDFYEMFSGCSNLRRVPDYYTANGEYFINMFKDCISLQEKPQLDLSNALYTEGIFAGTPFENDPLF